MSATEYLAIVFGVLVVLVGGVTALLVGRRRRSLLPPRGAPGGPPAGGPSSGVDYAPGVSDGAEVPPDARTRTAEHVELPGEPVLVEEPPGAA